MYESSLSRSSGKTTDASAVPAEGGKGVKVVQRKKKRDVPQLGAQSKQAISPLKVAPTTSHRRPMAKLPTARELQFAAEAGLSLSQVDPYGNAPLPSSGLAFNYVKGGPMVPPEVVKNLPTRLFSLNTWYEKVAKEGKTQVFFMAGKNHFLRQEYEVPIDFAELFNFFNLRDLDLPIISAYCL
jgi:hypothetical protein